MRRSNIIKMQLAAIVLSSITLTGCMTSARGKYFGKTEPPAGNTLRYISGSEPESLDPQLGTGQPEARVYMALYEGLVEYEPKTMEPKPELATKWDISPDGMEYTFQLRKDAKWSNGDPITANDFVYTFRRGFDPDNAFRNANLGYYIKYAEPYNNHSYFMKNEKGEYLYQKDFSDEPAPAAAATAPAPVAPVPATGAAPAADQKAATETEFSKLMRAPARLTINGDALKRAQQIQGSEKIKAIFKYSGKDFKNPASMVSKINSGTDGLSQFLRASLSKDVLSACATEAGCGEVQKQALADDLNKLADGAPVYDADRFQGVTISSEAKAFLTSIEKENKKRADAAKVIDEEAALIEDPAKKAEKEKTKKKAIGNLFYLNRFMIDDVYKDEIAKPNLVAASKEDVGVEAIDDYTLRLTLTQPAPFFLDLLPHQFFRLVPQKAIEKYGKAWTRPENIVTCGPFKVKAHKPYDILQVVRDPNYWDAATVKLDGIDFYPLEEQTTMLNLYKSGSVDSTYNHTVPASWVDEVSNYKDEYLKHPEVANEYYSISVKKPPMNDVRVRRAFSMAIDRDALSKFRRTTSPLRDFTPENIFPKYEEARKKVFELERAKHNVAPEIWNNRNQFRPETACNYLKDAGYEITPRDGGKCTIRTCDNSPGSGCFPVNSVNINYNTIESNRQVAEFVQAQWKQNLGITVPLKNMEWKTFLPFRSGVQYEGFARNGWVGDYMDPFTFLNLFYSEQNDGATGFYDPKYDALLDQANKILDPQERFEKMAEAEFQILDQQLVIPLQTQTTNWIKKPYVKGLYPNPGTLHAWKYVYIERDPAKWDTEVANIMKIDNKAE